MSEKKLFKTIVLSIALVVGLLIIWKTIDILLISFAGILLAILLNAMGRGAQKITHLPYPLALITSLFCILGLLTLTFWLYSPLIADQSARLIHQLPQAISRLLDDITRRLGIEALSSEVLLHEFTLNSDKFFSGLVTVFSSTIGSLLSFLIFLIIGLYLALNPSRYINWILFFIPPKKQEHVWHMIEKIGKSLRWWLLGKILAMCVTGLLTFIGLRFLDVSLALILGILAALLAFIPYVGAIIAAIPAILIAFAQSPVSALSVTCLYLIIHLIEGYGISPYIEQRTVSIPPALTIMGQVLLLVLVGPLGLSLATPLIVVCIALVIIIQSPSKLGDQMVLKNHLK